MRSHRRQRVATKVIVLENGTLCLCDCVGHALVVDETMAVGEVALACIGPCTSILQDSLRRRHGSMTSADTVDDGSCCLSLFDRGRTCWDLEVVTIRSRDNLIAAQHVALLLAKTVFRLATAAHAASVDGDYISSSSSDDDDEENDIFVTPVAPLHKAKAARVLMGHTLGQTAVPAPLHRESRRFARTRIDDAGI